MRHLRCVRLRALRRRWGDGVARSSSALAEVGRDDGRVGADLGRRAGRDLTAEVEHGDPVADAHHEGHVVLDHEDAEPPLLRQPANDRRELGRLGCAEPGRRLVEQQDRRRDGDRARDRDEAPAPVREVADAHVEVLPQLELLHRRDRRRARAAGSSAGRCR